MGRTSLPAAITRPASILGNYLRDLLRREAAPHADIVNLSLRDIEELLLERGVSVTYETVREWSDKFGADFARRAKAARRKPGSTWHLDEMFVSLHGEPYVLWRAVDERGTELDILLQRRHDKTAAKRFFRRVLRSAPVPRKIVTVNCAN